MNPMNSSSVSRPTDLFPSATSSGVTASSTSSRSSDNTQDASHNIYYLVFLGVVVALLLVAACLATRAMRHRQRYQAARQLAIARGGLLPDAPEFWEIPGWGGGSRARDRERSKGRWQKVPILWESTPLPAESQTLEESQPLTFTSRRPVDPPAAPPPEAPETGTGPRRGFYRAGRAPAHTQQSNGLPPIPNDPPEIDRQVEDDEDVRAVFIVELPAQKKRERTDEDDENGWEHGMELGIWDGRVEQ